METTAATTDEKKPNGTGNKTGVVIVAAGRGERAGQEGGPKQYRRIGGKTVLYHAMAAFLDHPAVDRLVVAIHADDHDAYVTAVADLPQRFGKKLLAPVVGGATRQQSVLNGLEALAGDAPGLVLIHDAARPFVTAEVIDTVVQTLEKAQAVLPSVPVADTIKRGNEQLEVLETVDRSGLYLAQTPQGFAFPLLLQAHRQANSQGMHEFTDDCALAEWAGMGVQLVMGAARNRKLTTADDIKEAEIAMTATLHPALPDVRVGHGYDTHQLVPGDAVWLCGLEIPHDRKLKGHSDADVGLHALTDALLSTIADGDIGSHFPPSDEKWRGAKSDQFLAHAVARVQAAGGTITHMDVTLLCEAPRIGPHRDAMRAAMAAITGIDVSRISVKATTNERIGFIGREEGIVALATATVVMGAG